MARGWESKSVEAQQEESSAPKPGTDKTSLTPDEIQKQRKKTDLTLSRSRVVQQLAASTNERYSAMLRQALAELDKQIADLQN
ncbi:MAG TPA: hypothetical protein VE779_00430 [Candidatus Angelobacter sp.]|jgi:flagellar motility protein MotE (MotC chaperone)|nr:hypothetical protein [Candidatus Angelobacter sp.]